MSTLTGGPIRLGSDAHKDLFCRTLLDTFNPYKPAVIDWPELEASARDRLVSLPIWDIAVQTEGRARLNVASYAPMAGDPLLRKAIELNAFEEGRHKHVLSNLVAAYGITLAPELVRARGAGQNGRGNDESGGHQDHHHGENKDAAPPAVMHTVT